MNWWENWKHQRRTRKAVAEVAGKGTVPPPAGAFTLPQGMQAVHLTMVGGGGSGGSSGSAGGGSGGAGSGSFVRINAPQSAPVPDELICYRCLLEIRDDLAVKGILQPDTIEHINDILDGRW